ncbi:mucin-2-like [Amphiprion ocellaris]|uniref:mucin-2-like n=1 Tax=Amphiprion ocellaris TaxID=80972 RepID=UPI0024111CBD|nr:mucin-2-like [Amphiprion ocellaris]
MKQAFILLVSIAMVFVAPGAQGSAHLSFSNIAALVTRTGCGTTKLCVETPEDCDPATKDTCLFTSVNATAVMAPNGTTLSFELSGTISGDRYVGVALTANASEGTGMLYVCGRNGTTYGVSGTFFFLTVQINNTNGALTVMNERATEIQNLTTDTKIQCVFDVPGVNASMARNVDTTFVLQLGSGSVNGSILGSFTANVTTPPLNLLDPTSNLNNNTTTTTTPTLNNNTTTTTTTPTLNNNTTTTTTTPTLNNNITTTTTPTLNNNITTTTTPTLNNNITTTTTPTLNNNITTTTTPTLNNNITTTTPPTTTPLTTMSGANRALFPQALPLLLSIFILYILKTA